MPVVGVPVERLRTLVGAEIAPDDLLRLLGYLGCDVEGYTQLERVRCPACGAIHEMTHGEEVPPACDSCGRPLRGVEEALEPLDVVRMELLAVRPDMFDPGGLARALRGYLGIETGAPQYSLGEPAARLTVEAAVTAADAYRPWIAAAVVENVELDEESLKIVMKLQENLHWAIGRDRKHASIGVYDFDTVAPELVYTAADPETTRFVPLGAPGTEAHHAQSLRQILEEHPKGIAYAHLLKGHARYPLLRDQSGLVLSMPPIINSEQTRVTLATRRFFIDVTGLAQRTVERTLAILVSSLIENLPQVTVHPVTIHGPGDEERVTPDFSLQETALDTAAAGRVLGIALDADQAVELLRRMRHDALPLPSGKVAVRTPAYRNDILHEMDLVEDLAIAYGYHRIEPTLVPTFTIGGERAIEQQAQRARAVLCGLGFLEVMNLPLTNPQQHDERLGWEAGARAVRIANPVSREQTMLRTSLLPGLLETFRRNLTNPLPQRICEVGEVTFHDPEAETGAVDRYHFACGIIAPRVGFEEIKAIAEGLAREFDCAIELRPEAGAPFFVGRAASARPAGQPAAPAVFTFGEVAPEALERWDLQNPTVLLEGDLLRLVGERA